ncbi:MAG: hypothetical protein NPIRA06_03660 [Nitrospirales bacterium]|nr:MAG: hypothetical protein NPIRA06_03660 [Nitrospirales bacterium]
MDRLILELYRTHGVELLKERGLFAPGHPDPVATTWVLSFQKIEQANPAAAELLRFCAFLHPDSIPEELITEGASELGPVLGPVAGNALFFNRAIGEILKFSLIHRDMPTQTLEIHRLVQAIILESLNDEARKQWIERFIRTMNRLLPDVKFETWAKCARLLLQAQHCAALILARNLHLQEGARVLNQTAFYFYERARYAQAEPLYQRALAIREEALGPTHPDVATSLNNLGELNRSQGKSAKAEPLYQRALAIREEALGPTHFQVALSLNNLAALYNNQGQDPDAEPLYQRALAIREEVWALTHPDVAQSLNNLGMLYINQRQYAEAKPLLQRALDICEEILGPEHPNTQTVRGNYEGLLKKMEGEKD